MKKYKTGRIKRVRAAAEKLGHFTSQDLIFEIDPDEHAEEEKIRSTLYNLRDRGEIRRAETGQWEFVQNLERAPDVRKSVARAMHIKGIFTIKDIKFLTDADDKYIGALIRRAIKTGHVERIGKKDRFHQYRVRNADRFYLSYIKEDGFADATA